MIGQAIKKAQVSVYRLRWLWSARNCNQGAGWTKGHVDRHPVWSNPTPGTRTRNARAMTTLAAAVANLATKADFAAGPPSFEPTCEH